jgi:hypothetical protein
MIAGVLVAGNGVDVFGDDYRVSGWRWRSPESS